MKRTTIKIPDELDARLRHEAERRGMTISELSREALEAHLGGRERKFLSTAAGCSGRSDISERIEEILRADWTPQGERAARAARRPARREGPAR